MLLISQKVFWRVLVYKIYASHDEKNIVKFDQNHTITIPIHILIIIHVTEWLIIDSKRQI